MKYLRIFFLVCFIQTMGYSQVVDDHSDCNAARKALKEGKINEAIIGFKKGAAKNCASSMDALGIVYSYPEYKINNYVEAKKWFTQASNAGYSEAKTNLAMMAYLGHGEPKNLKKSAQQLEELLYQSVTPLDIQYLSELYFEDSTAVDQKRLRNYLEIARLKQIPISYLMTAYVMLIKSESGDDPIVWLEKAHDADIIDAVMLLGSMYEKGTKFNSIDILKAKKYYAAGIGYKLDGAQEAYNRVESIIKKMK
ncbi:hypothetical protein [Sphingobacterium kyonggiense]